MNKNSNLPKISACMIVKDEEFMLPGCLESIKDFVDEIVVVDTGSTDKTVDIALSYGARVFHHPWENDFSKHRNQSIQYATGDWFLIIDADERLDTSGINKNIFKRKLMELPSDIHSLLAVVNDFDKNDNLKVSFMSPRIFRNNVGIHYKGIIHNRAVVSGKAIPSDIVISHYGYDLDPYKMAKKYERTRNLLMKRIEEDKTDYEAYFYLANVNFILEDFHMAIDSGKRCLECLPEDIERHEIFYGAYYIIGISYFKLEEWDEAKRWFYEGLKKLGKDIDLYFMLTSVGMEIEDYKLVEEYATSYLEYINRYRKVDRFKDLRFVYYMDERYEDIVRYRLLIASIENGTFNKKKYLMEKIKGLLYINPFYQRRISQAMIRKGYIKDVAELIIDLNRNAEKKDFFIGTIVNMIDAREYALEVLNTVFSMLSGDPDDQFEFSRVCAGELYKIGDLDNSIRFYKMAYDIHQGHPEVTTNYALLLTKKGRDKEAEHVFSSALEKGMDNSEFLMNAIHFYWGRDETRFEKALNILLNKIDDLRSIPEDILLIMVQYMIDRSEVDLLFQITEILITKLNIRVDMEIQALDQFSQLFYMIAEEYVRSKRYEMAKLALDVAYKITPNPEFMKKKGDLCMYQGDYSGCVNSYSKALEGNLIEKELISNMKDAFSKLGNREGIMKCEELMSQL